MFLRPARQLRSTFPRLFVFADDEVQEALRGAATQFRNDGEFVGSFVFYPSSLNLCCFFVFTHPHILPRSTFHCPISYRSVLSTPSFRIICHCPDALPGNSIPPPINKHHVSLVTRCFCSTSVAHRALAGHTSGWIRLIYNSSPSIHSITSRGSNGHNCLQ